MAEGDVCAVCGEAASDDASVVCNTCGDRFHLTLRNDRPGKDCGEVWINEQYLSLEFACRTCLDGAQPAQSQLKPTILRPRVGRRRYRRLR